MLYLKILFFVSCFAGYCLVLMAVVSRIIDGIPLDDSDAPDDVEYPSQDYWNW